MSREFCGKAYPREYDSTVVPPQPFTAAELAVNPEADKETREREQSPQDDQHGDPPWVRADVEVLDHGCLPGSCVCVSSITKPGTGGSKCGCQGTSSVRYVSHGGALLGLGIVWKHGWGMDDKSRTSSRAVIISNTRHFLRRVCTMIICRPLPTKLLEVR